MVRSKYILLILAAVLGFSSCKLGQKYARPELEIPDFAESDDEAAELLPWKELYMDEVLQELIEVALENNKDMLIAAAKIKEMMAANRISFANMFPEFDIRLNAQKEVLNYGGDHREPDPEYSVKSFFAWEVDLWGNLRWANDASLATYLQSVEAQRALRLTLISEVASKYYELCALDRELSIVQQTRSARQESVRLARLRFEGGLTSETAYRQAEVELARTETLIPELEKQISIKESDLSLLLGHYSGEIPRGVSLSEQELPDHLPVGLSSTLMERRPDIRRAEQKLKEANARVGVAYTNLFPRLRLTGNFGLESEELVDLLKSPAWFINSDLIAPLFMMGKNKARLKVAKARYEQELYSYEKSVLEAFREVHNALINVRKTKEVRAARTQLEISSRTYAQLAYLQYINGITSYMDVLDAQRRLLDAQIGLNNAKLDELRSIVSLYKALGGGY